MPKTRRPPQPCRPRPGQADRPEGAFDPGPVRRGRVRASRMGKRRAVVLLLVHVAIFAHLLHWRLAGRTLSPLEPSEAMYTIARGAVNAGAALLGASLVATLVLGRFFCGWACHLVALQDLCGWMLKKVGIRPRPLRSRWLVVVPLLAGLYMFFFPWIWDRIEQRPGPEYHAEFTKTAFWETFPGPFVAGLTFLVCGFVIIYLLGAKGFCTYACPYAGLFRLADHLAPGRIRVTDACKGCGHCSAVCTSNVLVHKEVHEYGAVVDSDCMKCFDCVSVCPENALYYGFGRPGILTRLKPRVRHRKPRPRTLAGREELLALGVFGTTLLVLSGLPRGPFPWAESLYGQTPLLLSLGVAACSAWLGVLVLRLVRRPRVGLQGAVLKEDGRLRRMGGAALLVAGAWFLFLAHGAVVQVQSWSGTRRLAALRHAHPELQRSMWAPGSAAYETLPEEARRSVDTAAARLERADTLGLFADPRLIWDRAWLEVVRGRRQAAAGLLARAARAAPEAAGIHFDRARLLALEGRSERSLEELQRAAELAPDRVDYLRHLGELRLRRARALEARGRPEAASVELGRVRELLGRMERAVEQAPAGSGSWRLLAAMRLRLARHLQQGGDTAAAAAELRQILRRHPDDSAARLSLAGLLLASGDPGGAEQELRKCLRRNPGDKRARAALVELLQATGRGEEARNLREAGTGNR